MMVLRPLILGLKLLYVQWNRSLVNILMLSFILSITLLTTINTLSDRISSAITAQNDELLGAPWLISSSRPLEESWIQKAQSMNLEHTLVSEFITMAEYNKQSILSSIKAIDPPYPLVGTLVSTDKTHPLPDYGHAWVTKEWVDHYGAKLGETIQVGDLSLKISGIIEREPDVNINFMNFAPRIILQRSMLPLTRVIVPGSKVEYRLLINGPEKELSQFADWVKPQLNENQRIISAQSDRPELGQTLHRAKNYLLLISFASILLAGMTIFLVMREYASEQINIVALLRTLGASRLQLCMIYLVSLSVIGLVIGLISVELGYLIQDQIAHILLIHFGMNLPPATYVNYFLGIATGLIILNGMSLPFLLNLINTPPIKILQHEIKIQTPSLYVIIALSTFTFFVLLTLYSDHLAFSAQSILLILTTAVSCSILAIVMILTIYKITPWVLMPYRLGITRLRHHLRTTIIQIIGISLSLILILSLAFIRCELLSDWEKSLPPKAFNHYIYNIVPEDLNKIEAFFTRKSVLHTEFLPVVMARLIAVNDKPIANLQFSGDERPNYLRRELNNTSMDTPRQIDVLREGLWWSENASDNLVSVESSIAMKLDIRINDVLTFRSGDRVFTASVANIRDVNWTNFHPNFYMIFSNHTLKEFPHTYMASFYYPHHDQLFIKNLTDLSRSATTVSIAELLLRIKNIVDQTGHFMSILLLIISLSTILLLYTIQCAQFRTRSAEDIILRILGASRHQLFRAFLVEVILLSSISALSSYLIAYGVCHYLSSTLFQISANLSLFYLIIAFLFAFAMQFFTGIRPIRKIQRQTPQLSLSEN